MANPGRRHPRYLFRDQKEALVSWPPGKEAPNVDPRKHDPRPGQWLDEVDEFMRTAGKDVLESEIEEGQPVYRPEAAEEAAESLGPLDS